MKPTPRAALALAALAALAAAPLARAQEPDFEKILKDKSPAIVTVKFLLKMSMGGQDQSTETEIPATMIDPKGIVLCSNTQLGGYMGLLSRFMPSGSEMSSRPTDLKVLVGDDTQGLEAKLLARDTDLDLAWIKIKDPGGKTFAALDFSKGMVPKIGQKLLWVWRLSKHFDRVGIVGEARISGATKKPRELFIPSGASGFGVPVFAATGEMAGMTILQMPSAEDAGGNPMEMMGAMMGNAEAMAPTLLPAAEIAKATARALEDESSEKKDAGEKKDADEKKDAGEKKEGK